MANAVSLASIQLQVRQQCDIEKMDPTNGFVTDAMLLNWANLELADLVGLISNRFNQRLTKIGTQAVTGATDTYPLPADFFRMDGIDADFGTGNYQNVGFLQNSDRNVFNSDIARAFAQQSFNLAARLEGANLVLQPNPPPTCTLRLHYTPTFTRFALTTDTFDFVNGWEAMIIAGMCARVRRRREEDPGPDQAEKSYQRQRIIGEASNRIAGAARRMASVRGSDW